MDNANCAMTPSDLSKANEILSKRITENKELISELGSVIQRLGTLEPMNPKPEELKKNGGEGHINTLCKSSDMIAENNESLNYLLSNLKKMI
jgi:hypothetical protein